MKKRPIKIMPSGLSGENEEQSFSLEGCLHFSVENTGANDVKIGFQQGDYTTPLKAGQYRTYPHLNPDCMEYEGKLYIKFAAKSTILITCLFDSNS